jgi:hypothetical protein
MEQIPYFAMPAFKTTDSGIQLHPHHIFIPGASKLGMAPITIREQTLARYAEFLTQWEIAAAQSVNNPTGSFASLWVHDAPFRSAMTAALAAVGVDEPEKLRVGHLSELLLSASLEGDSRPLIFQLHSDSPDPKVLGAMVETTQQTKTPPPSTFWTRFTGRLRNT